MESVRPADQTGPYSSIAREVAVVVRDDLIARRIGDALARDAITVAERAADVAGLSDRAAEVNAIVLAGSTAMCERQALIRAASGRFPGVPTLVVGSSSTNGVHKALEAGASGLVLDSEMETALSAAVRAVCAGQAVVPSRSRRHAIRPALSHREKETLALVATGLTNRQIAARLFLAESTVKTHLTSIFGKLGVGSRSEAAALVLDPEEKLGVGILDLAAASTDRAQAHQF